MVGVSWSQPTCIDCGVPLHSSGPRCLICRTAPGDVNDPALAKLFGERATPLAAPEAVFITTPTGFDRDLFRRHWHAEARRVRGEPYVIGVDLDERDSQSFGVGRFDVSGEFIITDWNLNFFGQPEPPSTSSGWPVVIATAAAFLALAVLSQLVAS